MKRYVFPALLALLLVACNGSNRPTTANTCPAGEDLLFQSETFSSYTEDRMRGKGIISFTMNINDRLSILNEDDSSFGEIVLNEDMTFFTLTMPKKVTARKLIAEADFAAFDFDAENVNTDKDYLIIYVNKERRKVKKSDLSFTFKSWESYVQGQVIKLKDCNLLTGANGKANSKSGGLAFTVTELKGDEINIKSTKDCLGEDVTYQELAGTVKWKSGDVLTVNFALCN